MAQNQIILFTLLAMLVHFASGRYIHGVKEQHKQNAVQQVLQSNQADDEWSTIKRKLGLSEEKVAFLKSQTDQDATMDLVNQFMKENPKYVNLPAATTEAPNHFLEVYHALIKQLKLSKNMLKTSLKFELTDKPKKNLKRSRRKIAVKMVSDDMPSEKIDELLDMFNAQHGLNSDADLDADADADVQADESEYKDDVSPDYVYDHLYDDEAIPAKSHHNSEFGSFQDLILQAQRNLLQRELEETKLKNQHNNGHFV